MYSFNVVIRALSRSVCQKQTTPKVQESAAVSEWRGHRGKTMIKFLGKSKTQYSSKGSLSKEA